MHQVSTATSNHHPITHLNVSPMPFHLPTVICHSDIEPSAADNMLSQQQSSLNMDISHMSFSSVSAGPHLPPPSVDFLDYLDAGSLDSASDVQYNVAIATGPGDEGGNPINHHWVTVSPERPRMFPRKLY
ncbi:MAG: hypothetical protein MJE68_31650 [Proteobacteria bacterium]|nr:hypothetical protein [Pseudomonadota bacterium]